MTDEELADRTTKLALALADMGATATSRAEAGVMLIKLVAIAQRGTREQAEALLRGEDVFVPAAALVEAAEIMKIPVRWVT